MTTYRQYDDTKDSKIPWLGKIPRHWTIDRLKWSSELLVNGIWGSEPDGIDDIFCVRVADFDRTALSITTDDLTVRAIPKSDRRRRLLQHSWPHTSSSNEIRANCREICIELGDSTN